MPVSDFILLPLIKLQHTIELYGLPLYIIIKHTQSLNFMEWILQKGRQAPSEVIHMRHKIQLSRSDPYQTQLNYANNVNYTVCTV